MSACWPGTSGDVLEIGSGTGANLPYYGGAVASLTLTEAQPPMLLRLERSAAEQYPPAAVLRAPAEDLPFPDHSFDVAVSMLVLCGVDDQPRALRELRRVLRPGGRLLFWSTCGPRCADGPAAGPDELAQPDRGLLRLQPADARVHQGGGIYRHPGHHTVLPKTPKFVRPAIVGSATAPALVPAEHGSP